MDFRILLLALLLSVAVHGQFTSTACSCDDGGDDGNDGGSCDVSSNTAPDHHWRLIFPVDRNVECRTNEVPEIQWNNEFSNQYAARIHGYAYEQNRCDVDIDCNDGICDFDDDGRGVNAYVSWEFLEDDTTCDLDGMAPGSFCDEVIDADCAGPRIRRTFKSFTFCPCLATPEFIFGQQTLTTVDDDPPLIYPPPDITIECGESTLVANTGTAVAHDRCDPTLTIVNDDSDTGLLECGADSVIRRITRTFTATDSCTRAATTGPQEIYVVDTTAPQITTREADLTLQCAAAMPGAVANFAAVDGCATITETVEDRDIFTSTPTCANKFIRERVYEAEDACGNRAEHVQTITVSDTEAPVFATPAGPAFTEGTCRPANFDVIFPPVGSVVVTDNCDTPTTTLERTGTPDPTKVGTYNEFARYTASDSCGNVQEVILHHRYVSAVDFTLSAIAPINIAISNTAVIGTTFTATGCTADLGIGDYALTIETYPFVPISATGFACETRGSTNSMGLHVCRNTAAYTVPQVLALTIRADGYLEPGRTYGLSISATSDTVALSGAPVSFTVTTV